MQLKDTNGNKYIADKMKNKSSHFFLKDEDNKKQRNQEIISLLFRYNHFFDKAMKASKAMTVTFFMKFD